MLTLSLVFTMLKTMKKIHLKNGETLKVKRGCYTMKDIEKVSSGKIKYNSLTGKSVIDPTISQLGPYMKKILGITNGNYMDMLLSRKTFSFKINKLSTTDNIFNGKPCDVLYTGYLNKDISFGTYIAIANDDSSSIKPDLEFPSSKSNCAVFNNVV